MFLDTAIRFLRSSYGYALVAIALFASGALVGWLHEHENLIKYRASVQALAEEQERHNAEIIARHNETTKDIHDDYKKRLSDLRSYYNDRVRDQDTCRVSPAANAAIGTDGNPSNNQPLTTTDAEQCAAVTLQLLELQQWVDRKSVV